MVKRPTRTKVRVRDPETEGWRFAFVQRCYARGMHPQEILTACEQSGLFDTIRRKSGSKRSERRPLSRQYIKTRYLTILREKFRTSEFDAAEELRLAYLRYLEAYRLAVSQENPKTMVAAVKEIVSLLGLERSSDQSPENLASQIQDQLVRMDQAMRGNSASGD